MTKENSPEDAYNKQWADYRAKFKGDSESESMLDGLEKARAVYRQLESKVLGGLKDNLERGARKAALLERIANQLQQIQDLVK